MMIEIQRGTKEQIVGGHLAAVIKGLGLYMKANHVQLESDTLAGPVTITVSMLVNGGMVPPGLKETNSYGQTLIGLIRLAQPPDQLEGLVISTGGQEIDDAHLSIVASAAGAAGGYIKSQDPSVATGLGGQWIIPLAPYQGGSYPMTPGHLAGMLYYNSGVEVTNYLSRVKVPGDAGANTMQTGINMNNNSVSNASDITTGTEETTGNVTIGGTLGVTGDSTLQQNLSVGQTVTSTYYGYH